MSETKRKYEEYVITSFSKGLQPVVVTKASGAIITDSSGEDYIDCFAGISVVNAGHCNPEVVAAAKAQIDKLIHCASYVYYSPPTADLAEKLAAISPGRLRKSFFANSGAEAVDGALKLARLYTGKHEVIALQAGFHGRTWGALSVTGNASRKRRGGPYAPGVTFVPAPYSYRSLWGTDPAEICAHAARSLEEAIQFSTSNDVAAFIAEPVLGEGGILVPPPGYFRAIKEILDKYDILLVIDEVQTGFGRTGRLFGIEHYDVEPDILITAKGIADGFPLGAFTTRDEIAEAFQPGDHLSTFGGNPVSCAAALANIEFIEKEHLCEQADQMGEMVMNKLRSWQNQFPLIGEVRGKGLMIGLELVRDSARTPAAAEAETIRTACRERRILVGVGGVNGNVVRIQPPLVITEEQLTTALRVLEEALRAAA